MAEIEPDRLEVCRPEQERTQAVAGRVRRCRESGGDLRGRGAGAPDLRLRQQRAAQSARGDRSDARRAGALRRATRGALKAALSDSLRETARAAELQSYEVPPTSSIETEPFSAANGLLSGVGKILRPRLKEHYGERLEQLYAELAAARVDELRALRENAADRSVLDSVMSGGAGGPGLDGRRGRPRVTFHRPRRRLAVGADLRQPAAGHPRRRRAGRCHRRSDEQPAAARRIHRDRT